MAQPPRSGDQKGQLNQAGRHDHTLRAQGIRQFLGQDKRAAGGENRQLHQESLEFDDPEEDEVGVDQGRGHPRGI